jgi:FemAB-related protein (PEP-CTERM system-associated)
MTLEAEPQTKRILADPVAAYSALRPDAEEQKITMLHELQRQYRDLAEEQRKIRETTRGISSRIGAAKRNGEPVDELKQSMQEMSSHLKSINDRLSDTQNRILGFFIPCDNERQTTHSESEAIATARHHAATPPAEESCSIALLDDELDEWNAYVRKNPDTKIYHRAEWRDLIRKTFGHQDAYYIARDPSRNIVGVLPLIRLQSLLFGDFMVSMPYFNYGGAVADHDSVERSLMGMANEHARQLGVSHVEYRDVIPRSDLAVRTDKVSMILQLPDSVDSLWNSFTSKLRSQIRRPLRESPETYNGGIEYLDDFYTVFARNMRDLGTPVYSKAFFGNILDCFPQESRIIVVRLGDMPVAAGFLLGYKGNLEIPWASSIRDVSHLSMNMLLYWEVLRFAVQEGYRRFDFGRSSKGSGTYRFKQQWGARPEQSYWHYWLGAGHEPPALNPDNPRYALAIKLWKRLPLVISNRLGPWIVRNLP